MQSSSVLINRIKYEKFYSIIDEEIWRKISATPGLTEEFIFIFRDRVDWLSICVYQYLTEEFLYKLKDYILPIYVIAYQEAHLSKKCIEWLHDLYWKKK